MKSLYYIILLFLFCTMAQDGFSQTTQRRTPRQRASEQSANDLPALTVRAMIKNETGTTHLQNVVWLREIYRYIDLEKENNAALYYPTQPIGKRMNLFTLIFKLMAEGKVVGYNYLDGREVFTEEEKINFEDVLKRFQVLYTTQGSGDNAQYIVEDSDIPSSEVTMYMIKEAYYFDQATGTYNTSVIAICPMLVRQEDDFGEPTRNPVCWIPYENIRPYLSREPIMTSNYNNALTYTIDDYFAQRMYVGDIVKTTNLMNQSLAQQVGNTPEALKQARDSIENQLKSFEKQLWVQEDTTTVVADKKEKGKSVRGSSNKKEKVEKPKESKAEKSSTPTKSVRRRR